MTEKTYTLTELVTNLRNAQDSGLLDELRIPRKHSGAAFAIITGYELTAEGYDKFDADLTALGL